MSDNEQSDLAPVFSLLMRTVDKETKRLLARELRSMADFKGIYSVYKDFTTPLVAEMWRSSADYLENDVEEK